jgi:deoxyribonuclease (pyrimidine dimer)
MTRISVGYSKQLIDKNLNRERIEVLRIPNAIKKGTAKVNLKKIPKDFRLGHLHVVFFYDKIGFLKRHYEELTAECIRRGFNPTDYSNAFEGIPKHLMNDYTPTEYDRQIVRERIAERLKTMQHLKYNREPITIEEAINKLND